MIISQVSLVRIISVCMIVSRSRTICLRFIGAISVQQFEVRFKYGSIDPMVDGFGSIRNYMSWFVSSSVRKSEVWFHVRLKWLRISQVRIEF